MLPVFFVISEPFFKYRGYEVVNLKAVRLFFRKTSVNISIPTDRNGR